MYHQQQHPQPQNSNLFQMAQSGAPPHGQQQSQQQQHTPNDLVSSQTGPEPETVYLYIPNVAVGAIIGTKGSYIKNIIKLSSASVKITPLTPEESKVAVERQVVIVGTPESQWKAQYYIYDKIRQERFASDENVKLRAELQVPSHIVGRIIGKSGKNVRELQRSTGATIKLPEDVTASSSSSSSAATHPSQSQEQTQTAEAATEATASNTGEQTATSADSTTTKSNGQQEAEVASTTTADADDKTEAKAAAAAPQTAEKPETDASETKSEQAASLDATAVTSSEQDNAENAVSTVTPLQGSYFKN